MQGFQRLEQTSAVRCVEDAINAQLSDQWIGQFGFLRMVTIQLAQHFVQRGVAEYPAAADPCGSRFHIHMRQPGEAVEIADGPLSGSESPICRG